ncbi:hypothetical protein ACVIWV_001537 [Bradyrhizobium diazoefficiens]
MIAFAPSGARDQVGVTADIFGQRVQRKVRAMLDRPLKHRPEQRIVAGDDRRMPLGLSDRVGDAADHRDVDEAIGRVGRGLDQDHRNPALAHRLLRGLLDRRLVDAVGKADSADRQARKRVGQQGFRPAIERLGVQDDVAGAHEGEDRGCDGRHAGGEQRAALGALIDREPVLDDFAVGVVEARIDQARAHPLRRLAPAGDVVEEVLPVFGGLEHEGRGQEHRRLDGAFRQLRIIAIGQHQRFRMQHMVADVGLRRKGFYHGQSRC